MNNEQQRRIQAGIFAEVEAVLSIMEGAISAENRLIENTTKNKRDCEKLLSQLAEGGVDTGSELFGSRIRAVENFAATKIILVRN